jgi:hypothetical protein
MADDRLEKIDPANPGPVDTPRPEKHKGITGEAEDTSTLAARAVLSGEENTIRSVYVARTAASAQGSPGDFGGTQAVGEGPTLRGAYMRHLFEFKAEAVGGEHLPADDTLRHVYVARTVGAAPSQRIPSKKTRGGKSARKKGKAATSGGRGTKARKAAASPKRSKPRTVGRSAAHKGAARPGRAGKRSRRR